MGIHVSSQDPLQVFLPTSFRINSFHTAVQNAVFRSFCNTKQGPNVNHTNGSWSAYKFDLYFSICQPFLTCIG